MLYRFLRAWVYYLIKEEVIDSFKLTLPKCDESYEKPYSDNELRLLMKKPESNSFVEWRTWCLEAFLIGIGCRISTALNVKICDLNFEDGYLFNNSYEVGPIAKSTAQQEIRAYNRKRGVSKTSAHLFRHTYAKNYICAGGGVFQLQRILGHADISTTRHYVSLYNSNLKKDYDALCPLDNILK